LATHRVLRLGQVAEHVKVFKPVDLACKFGTSSRSIIPVGVRPDCGKNVFAKITVGLEMAQPVPSPNAAIRVLENPIAIRVLELCKRHPAQRPTAKKLKEDLQDKFPDEFSDLEVRQVAYQVNRLIAVDLLSRPITPPGC
jgi:hypothetical protein